MSLSDSSPPVFGSSNSPRLIDCSPPASCSSASGAIYSAEPNLMGSEMLFNINMETMDALLNTAIRAEYNVSVDLVRGDDPNSPLSPVRDRQLNEIEKAKLQELVVANKALLAPLTEDGPVNVIIFYYCIVVVFYIGNKIVPFNYFYSYTTIRVIRLC